MPRAASTSREDRGRVERRVLERDRALPGLGADRIRAGEADVVRPEVALRTQRGRRAAADVVAVESDAVVAPTAGSGRRGPGRPARSPGGDREVRAVVVEGERRDLGAVPPDEVAPTTSPRRGARRRRAPRGRPARPSMRRTPRGRKRRRHLLEGRVRAAVVEAAGEVGIAAPDQVDVAQHAAEGVDAAGGLHASCATARRGRRRRARRRS